MESGSLSTAGRCAGQPWNSTTRNRRGSWRHYGRRANATKIASGSKTIPSSPWPDSVGRTRRLLRGPSPLSLKQTRSLSDGGPILIEFWSALFIDNSRTRHQHFLAGRIIWASADQVEPQEMLLGLRSLL